jgi:protein TonB
MFEDSTFESNGKIQTRSRGWMIATLAFNTSVLLALILIPLFYPEALPRVPLSILMQAPPTPVEQPKPIVQPEHATVVRTEMPDGSIVVPSRIPKTLPVTIGPEVVIKPELLALGPDGDGSGSPDKLFRGSGVHPVIVPATRVPKPVSSGVMQGYLIRKVVPEYPAIGRAIRLAGR